MSLDVYLLGPEKKVECTCIDCGHAHTRKTSETLYTSNITHNLGAMAHAAGIEGVLWAPEKVGIKTAIDLVWPLTKGLRRLKRDPEKFKAYNPANGWGDYDGLVEFVAGYLEACKRNPDARVEVSR